MINSIQPKLGPLCYCPTVGRLKTLDGPGADRLQVAQKWQDME